MEKHLFNAGDFQLHSGSVSQFKIDCDALTGNDWQALAYLISQRFQFKAVWGVPTGGTQLRRYLSLYCIDNDNLPTLIVDDVLTTGNSMEVAKASSIGGSVIGCVIFSRGKCPNWITPIFQMWGNDAD